MTTARTDPPEPDAAASSDADGADAGVPEPTAPVPSDVDGGAPPADVDATAAPVPSEAAAPAAGEPDAAASGQSDVDGAVAGAAGTTLSGADDDRAAPAPASDVDGAAVADAPPSDDVSTAADAPDAGPDADADGELAVLGAALAADDGSEPRRHWLRYPGLVGALAVIGLLMLIPCGAGTLFFTGAFADSGRFGRTPDACSVLDAKTVHDLFGGHLESAGRTGAGDDSTCQYQGSAAVRADASVTLTLTRYGTKGPLSAPRMAHAALTTDADDGGVTRAVPGLGDEAVALDRPTGVTVYARVSNVVLRLEVSTAAASEPEAVDGARTVAAALR